MILHGLVVAQYRSSLRDLQVGGFGVWR